jgi:hypothetical protein
MEVLRKEDRHQVNRLMEKNIEGDIALFTEKNNSLR